MKNIYKALADFQQEVPVIHKDTSGFNYSYADLPKIFEVINPLLKKHGLGFYQAVNKGELKTVVFHVESGETLESNTDIPQGVQLNKMNEFQVLGSGITYLRRYALSSLLGLVTDKDTDASGEQVGKRSISPENAPKTVEKPKDVQSTLSPRQQAEKDIKEEDDIFGLNNLNDKIQKSKILSENDKEELSFIINEKLETLDPTK